MRRERRVVFRHLPQLGDVRALPGKLCGEGQRLRLLDSAQVGGGALDRSGERQSVLDIVEGFCSDTFFFCENVL